MSVESDEYLSFSAKINEYISAYMLGLDMNVKEYQHEYLWEQIIGDKVKLRPFPFEKSARRAISGMIVKDEHEVTVAFNSSMSSNRKNFTVSHELVHFLYHLNDEQRMFTDTKDSLNYSLTDLLPEFQANIGASAILLPEPVLINELKEGIAPYYISKKYGISEQALYIRLVQQMQANFEASYIAASRTANKIMRGHSKGSAIELGKNLEKKALITNPFYEAICL